MVDAQKRNHASSENESGQVSNPENLLVVIQMQGLVESSPTPFNTWDSGRQLGCMGDYVQTNGEKDKNKCVSAGSVLFQKVEVFCLELCCRSSYASLR